MVIGGAELYHSSLSGIHVPHAEAAIGRPLDVSLPAFSAGGLNMAIGGSVRADPVGVKLSITLMISRTVVGSQLKQDHEQHNSRAGSSNIEVRSANNALYAGRIDRMAERWIWRPSDGSYVK